MVTTALFDINADGEDRGFQATPSQVLTLRLRPPVAVDVGSVVFQVYSESAFDPDQGIDVNPPRASKDAPLLTIVGATSGQSVSPSTPSGTVSITLPASAGHSYLVRCIVNGGWRALPGGGSVFDPQLIHHRGVWIPTGFGTRKIIGTEVNEFTVGGWADAINDMIALGGAVSLTFLPAGLGAVSRQIGNFLDQGIHVFSFMSDTVRADAIAGTLGFDHQPFIQFAIDFAIYMNALGNAPGPRVSLGGAVYRADRPVHVGYGLDFRSVEVVGDGRRYGGTNHAAGSGTCIVSNFSNAPGIVVQGGRNVVLKGFSMIGKNFNHCAALAVTPTMDNVDLDTWIDPTLDANADSRYAPYAGIAIDPYSGTQPGTHYPTVTYPAWLGTVPQYGKEASSETQIIDVSIWGYVTGVAQQPSDYDGNGDYTKLRNCQIRFCAYGFSYGNSQSRALAFYDCTFVTLHTGIASGVHGKRIGKPDFTMYSCELSLCMKWMDIPTMDYGNGPLFSGCYAEACYSLGHVGGVAAEQGDVIFEKCEFGFSLWETYGVPTYVFEQRGVSFTTFKGCSFTPPVPMVSMLNFYAPSFDGAAEPARAYAFEQCSTWQLALTEKWQYCAYNGTLGISISKGSTSVQAFSVRSGSRRNLDTGALLPPGIADAQSQGPRSKCLPAYAKRARALANGNDPGIEVAWRVDGYTIPGAVSAAGRNITFTFPSVDTNYLGVVGGDVGDPIICEQTGAVFVVKARTLEVITAMAMSGFDASGNLLNAVPNAGAVFHAIHCRHYTPAVVLYGNITSGSPTITGIIQGDGGAPDLTAHFAVGDLIHCDREVDNLIFAFSAGILSMDNTAKTITFGTNFNFTRTRMRLGAFIRLPMPNAA
jgi:hypothetical protein